MRTLLRLLACSVALALPAAYSATCTVSAIGVNFGNYDVFSTLAADITGSISVSCDASTAYSISLSSGSGPYSARTLASGPSVLNYNLYLDPTHLTIWGDGSGGTGTVSGTAMSASYTVYGRIPARQNVPVGSYGDVITVTLTF